MGNPKEEPLCNMSTEYFKQLDQKFPNNNLTSLGQIIGLLLQLSSGEGHGTIISGGINLTVNIVVNAPQGGGATVNYVLEGKK